MNLKKWNKGSFAKLCPVIFFFLLAANLYAQNEVLGQAEQNPRRISLSESVELAIQNNLSLETTRVNLATRERASDLSWNQFIPNVTVTGAFTRENEASTISGFHPVPIPGFDPIHGVVPFSAEGPQWNIGIPIQVSLNLNAAMFENMRRLRLDFESGILGYERARAQLERDVRKMYHNMLLLQENIILLRGTYQNMAIQVGIAQANFQAGLMPELSLLQARVAQANLRPVMDQAESGLRLSMAQFAMTLGLDTGTAFELIPVETAFAYIPFDVTEMISQANARRPDILELRHQILMLESARRAQALALTPVLSLSWNTTPAFIGPPVEDWVSPRPGALTVALSLRLHSLIPFSQDFQGIRALDDQLQTANLGLAQMIRGSEIEIYHTILELERIRLTIEAQAQTIALAEQSYNLTLQAYQAGLQDFFQVQSAEQSLRQARVQMLEQQFNYLNGLIDLEYAIGVPFGTLSN